MIATFGATTQLAGSNLQMAKNSAKNFGFDHKNVNFRKGRVYQFLPNMREVTWGNNVIINNYTSPQTIKHELAHINQYYQQGWSIFQGRGVYEQSLYSIFNVQVYDYREFGQKYQESDASVYEYLYR